MESLSKQELISTITKQADQIKRYEGRLRDVVAAYKGLVKEKEALDISIKALSRTETNVDAKQDSIAALTLSLSTLTAEKARMEEAFQADKKVTREKYEGMLASMREETKSLVQNHVAEVANLRAKIAYEIQEREKERADYAAMLNDFLGIPGDDSSTIRIMSFRGKFNNRGHSGNNHYTRERQLNQYREDDPPVERKNSNNQHQQKTMSSRDKKRTEAYREKKNVAAMDAIAEDFNKILHPGFASLAHAVKDLIITQKTARIVPVSTHAIGVIIRENILRTESEMQGRGQPLNYNRHAFYRVALAMFETKLYTQYKMRTALPYSSVGFGEITLPADLRDRCLGVKTHFLAFVNYLNWIGNLIVGDVPHYVGVPDVQTPFTITLGTLRAALEASFNGPAEIRNELYQHNPFPFCNWGFDADGIPLLTNAEDIMPANYAINEFLQDVEVCQQYFEFVNRKYPKRVSSAVNYELEGHKSVMVSCRGDIRCTDHVEEGVHARPYVEGDVVEFWTAEQSVSDQEFYYASLTMAGRVPDDGLINGFSMRSPVNAVKAGHLSARTNMSVHY